jgi:hypothetical protein
MPAYSNTASPSSIDAGDVANVWATADGNLASGTKTQRVALMQRSDGGATKLSFRALFSGAPGAISLQLQTADFDVDTDYSSEGSPVTTLNQGGNEARGEVTLVSARFARVLATTVTNAVTASLDIAA